MSKILNVVVANLERNIPQMISFIDTEIDLQPWEQFGRATYISSSETEVNLMSLVRDMMGYASVPAIFGRALLDKFPSILHDVYNMDAGIYYFLMRLPPWTPWPGVIQAHMARFNVWQCLDEHQQALDSAMDGKLNDSSWGDLDDVS